MKKRLAVVSALFALLMVGAGCGAAKAPVPTPAPLDRNGPPNAIKPQNMPVNEPSKPTADDGLDGALSDLGAAE